jgi:hypothetical protein
MTFPSLVLRNLLRQRVRTLLTVLGISVGTATVVASSAVTEGMRQTSSAIIRAGNSDIMVAQNGASDLSFSAIRQRSTGSARGRTWLAIGVLNNITGVGSNAFFPEMGVRPDQLAAIVGRPTAGRSAGRRAQRGGARRERPDRCTRRSESRSAW